MDIASLPPLAGQDCTYRSSKSCCLRCVNVFRLPGTAKIISIALPLSTMMKFPTGWKVGDISSVSVPVPSEFT